MIETYPETAQIGNPLLTNLRHIPAYLSRPAHIFKTYQLSNLQPDLMAGLTVGVIALPQAIAFALVAELPPVMGLYAVIIGAIVGGIWGSCNQMHSGPANAISILVLSILLTVATPGTPEFIVAAGMIAIMAGVFQLVVGLARLGVLVNFVSHSVIVGFSAGAGVLIVVNQIRHLLGLEFTGRNLVETAQGVFNNLFDIHWPTALLGLGTIGLIILARKVAPKIPGPLFGMIVASALVYLLGLDEIGVAVIGQLSGSLPPLASLPLFDLKLLGQLSTGALAVGMIGLIQTTAIARSIATKTGQRLSNNQEFVGQGLANIACGFFSGYAGAGSFSRSAVNLEAKAHTSLAAVFSSVFVLIAMFVLAPLGAYLPRTALAAVLIVTAFGLINRKEIVRILHSAPGDAIIVVATLFSTLFLPLQFAVLVGVFFSFARYIIKTSVPRVYSVLPGKDYGRFIQQQPQQTPCPQLGIIKISGDLYFGAVSHVENAIMQHLTPPSEQRVLLLRMQGVNHCDLRGIQMLESVRDTCRERGGDLFLMKMQLPVLKLLQSTGFYDQLGIDHFLTEDKAIDYLFHKVLDPAICIYECDVRIFGECKNLPKRNWNDIPLYTDIPINAITHISRRQLRKKMNDGTPPIVIDVREPREFKQDHIPRAQLIPLPKITSHTIELPYDREVVLVCSGGRRSTQAADMLQERGYHKVFVLQGGMLAWRAPNLKPRSQLRSEN